MILNLLTTPVNTVLSFVVASLLAWLSSAFLIVGRHLIKLDGFSVHFFSSFFVSVNPHNFVMEMMFRTFLNYQNT